MQQDAWNEARAFASLNKKCTLKFIGLLIVISFCLVMYSLCHSMCGLNSKNFPINSYPPIIHHNKSHSESFGDKGEQVVSNIMYASLEDLPNVKVKAADCENLFVHNKDAIRSAKEYMATNRKLTVDHRMYWQMAQNCQTFIRWRKYVTKPVNKEEAEYSIAFSILVYKELEMAERLLRAIYRPQNYYCIHVDQKASSEIRNSMQAIADCFQNVFLASRRINVKWGWWSVVEPELVCMEDLMKYKRWKYFINLTGQEFPLKTNWDLVKILKVYNGANDIDGTHKRRYAYRTNSVWLGYQDTQIPKDRPPYDMLLTKGSIHITASRAFVDFVLHSNISKTFQAWVNDTGIPDETFFSSLNHNPQLGVPGAYKGEPEKHPDTYPFITRFKNWLTEPIHWPCQGLWVREICVFNIGDLQLLRSRPELFANKFYLDYGYLAYDCMEELHYNRTRDEMTGKRTFSTEYYQGLSFVKNHV